MTPALFNRDFPGFAVVHAAFQGAVEVRVIRMGDSSSQTSIRLATRDGSGRSGLDYVPVQTIVEFAPLEVEKTVRIPFAKRHLSQPAITFSAFLSDPADSGASVSPALEITAYDDQPMIIANSAHLSQEGVFSFTTVSLPRTNYVIQRSMDLRDWVTVSSGLALATPNHIENRPPAGRTWFYRVISDF